MSAGRHGRSPGRPGFPGDSLDLIHTSKVPNPRQDSLSGRLTALLQAKIDEGAPFGCDRCVSGCDARPGCRLGLSPDQLAGITWWNGLTEQDRRFWLGCAVSAVPGDAWEMYKRTRGGDAKSTP